MDQLEREYDSLLASYREACTAPEASADFMPGVWRRIESRRRFVITLRRWTAGIVTAAAAVSVGMAIYMSAPEDRNAPIYSTTYVDALEEDATFEAVVYAEVAQNDLR